MIKFIVEVDEEYIHKKANPNDAFEEVDKKDAESVLVRMANMLSFIALEKKLEDGETEFVIKRDYLEEKAYKIFENTTSHLATLAVALKKDTPESKEE